MLNKLYIIIFISFFVQNSFSQYSCRYASTTPVIDGNPADYAWKSVNWAPIDIFWINDLQYDGDFEGKYKVLWKDDKLYFLVRILDDIIYDFNVDPLTNYPADDGVEIFIDEDASGGEHASSPNAWAYHLSIYGDVVDIGKDGAMLYNDHIHFHRLNLGDTTYWECAVSIYPDTYNDDLDFNPTVDLWEGKKMGFAVAYNDNDGSPFRETMIGSHDVNDINYLGEKNVNWKTADNFDSLYLWEGYNLPPEMTNPGTIEINSFSSSQQIELSGINDGDDMAQDINISAYSNSSAISNIIVEHTMDEPTALLHFDIIENYTGTATIYVRLKDDGGTDFWGIDTSLYDIQVNATPNSITENPLIFDIYPLPAKDFIQLSTKGPSLKKAKITFYDITGKLILAAIMNSQNDKIDISKLKQGSYIIEIKDDKSNAFRKILLVQ